MQKIFAVLVMLAFLIPNTIAIYRGSENFPFTACPMFAHYIGDHTQLYNFKFVGHTPAGDSTVLNAQYGADSEIMSMRFFFSRVYGSVDCPSSFGSFCQDTPRDLEERLSQYFTAYLAVLAKNSDVATDSVQRIDLEVWKYTDTNEVAEKHEVGHYDTQNQRFTHTWQPS